MKHDGRNQNTTFNRKETKNISMSYKMTIKESMIQRQI